MKLSPIILFVYNRPWHTQKTVEALQNNELAAQSELFIYSDAPKNENSVENVNKVREYIHTVKGFKNITIIEREKNLGLANSIIDGVTKIVNEYEKIIVLEDDLVTSPYFLTFMNEALEVFQERKDIFSITGFSFATQFMNFPKNYEEDIYLNIRPMSWSWASWKDRWSDIDWEVKDFHNFIKNKAKINAFNLGGTDLSNMLTMQMQGKIDSWYIRWSYHAIMARQLTVYPRISFVNNVGHDSSGVHCGHDKQNIYSHTELNMNSIYKIPKNIEINKKIIKNFNKAFNIKISSKIKQQIKKTLGYKR